MPQPRPDIQIDDDFPECKPFGYYAKRAIIELIDRQDDPTEKKAWIMSAYEVGIIDARDAEDWVVLCGLESA